MPERVQLRRIKGWRMPQNTVKVDRATKWGNPFVVGKHGDAECCVKLFERLCAGHICTGTTAEHAQEQRAFLSHAKNKIGDLRGKHLACWCQVGQPCHADILLAWANGV